MRLRDAMFAMALWGCGPDVAPSANPPGASGDAVTSGSVSASTPSAMSVASSSAAVSSSASVRTAAKQRPAPAGMCETDGALRAGSLRTSRVDLHDYARLIADVFRRDIIVFGDLPDPKSHDCPGPCLDFDERIESFESALKLSGARTTVRGGVAMVGELKSDKPAPALPGPSRDVDLQLVRVSAAAIAELLGQVHEKPVKGFPEGEITVVIKGRPALQILGLMAEAAGTTVRIASGALEVQPGGALPPVKRTIIEKEPSSRIQRDVLASDQALEGLRASIVVASPKGGVRALLSPKEKGGLSWVVRIGDFVGKDRVLTSPVGEVSVNARVERIHCLGIDVVHEDADPTRPPHKLVIPFE